MPETINFEIKCLDAKVFAEYVLQHREQIQKSLQSVLTSPRAHQIKLDLVPLQLGFELPIE